MSNLLIPYILFGKQDGVLLPKENKEANANLFSTIGWEPLEFMPNNKLRNVGYCRCGKGMFLLVWPEVKDLGLQAKTILRCHDHNGAGCKFSVTLPGLIRTYGGLLLALQDENSVTQGELIQTLIRDWPGKIAEREMELVSSSHERVCSF